MRIRLVALGAVLVTVGVVLLFVPLLPQGSETVGTGTQTPYYLGSVAGFSLTGEIPVAVDWTANAPVEMFAAACTQQCNASSDLSGRTVESGMSGSFTLDQPVGGEIILGAVAVGSSPANVTFTLTTALATVGTLLVVLGGFLLLIGIVLRSTRAPPPTLPPTAATAQAPGDTPASSATPEPGAPALRTNPPDKGV